MTIAEHVMTVSRNGQVSIPAQARARWNAHKMLVVDLGDRVVMRPLDENEDSVGEVRGKYRGKGPDSDSARRRARLDDVSRPRP